MFQNIARDSRNNQNEYEEENKKVNTIDVLKKLFAKENIMLYIITFLISMVGFSDNSLIISLSPFGLAMIAGALSNNRPIGIMYVLSLIGTFIGFGFTNFLIYFLTTLAFFISILLVRPIIQDNVNEKRKIGGHLFFSVLIVQAIPMFFRDFYIFELLSGIMLAMTAYVFYKIFANSITVIKGYGIKQAFTVEEVIGACLVLSIAIYSLHTLSIFGLSISNILSIMLVLFLGWKNGILIGATAGTTIGIVLGIIGNTSPILVASYAISRNARRNIK